MEEAAAKGVEIVAAFRLMLFDLGNAEVHVARIKAIETEADAVAHETISLLHQTFVTPLDRNEINRIFKRLDDVVDLVESAAQRYFIYEMRAPRAEVVQLVGILEKQVAEVRTAVGLLSDMRRAEELRASLIRIHTLENEADGVLRASMGALVREIADTKDLLKWKEVIESLEDATDRCEDLADLFENVLLEYA
jgi:hypothetical protein